MTDATTQVGHPALPKKETRRRFGIVLSLILVLAAAASALFLVRGVDSQLADVANTYEVRRQARELVLALLDAETGQRGFLLTQDRLYLEPYENAIRSIDTTYANLLKLLEGDPARGSRIGAIAGEIDKKRAEMSETISLASSGRLPDALVILRSDEGRDLMDGLRDTIGGFLLEEDAKLINRNAAIEQSRQLLVAAILAALAGAATLSYLMVTRTQRQVSSLARASSALQLHNEELEAHVRARTAEAEEARHHAERERARVEALLQDTNHRIGNSLGTVSSLLGLQMTRTRSDEVKLALEAAQSRVQAIASGHRRLRLGADLETTNAAEFLDAVFEDMRETAPSGKQVSYHTDLEPLVINARDATTIGIVLGELVTNALKHAFADGQPGEIWISFRRGENGVIRLGVEDNGNGISEGSGAETGLGAMIIKQLARQFGGEPSYGPRAGGGTSVSVSLPKLGQADPA